ncbi:hypothetical protein FB107DRAFT_252703, partial [Schizophyllum commune]
TPGPPLLPEPGERDGRLPRSSSSNPPPVRSRPWLLPPRRSRIGDRLTDRPTVIALPPSSDVREAHQAFRRQSGAADAAGALHRCVLNTTAAWSCAPPHERHPTVEVCTAREGTTMVYRGALASHATHVSRGSTRVDDRLPMLGAPSVARERHFVAAPMLGRAELARHLESLVSPSLPFTSVQATRANATGVALAILLLSAYGLGCSLLTGPTPHR